MENIYEQTDTSECLKEVWLDRRKVGENDMIVFNNFDV
jgi:hypothetical protein